MNREKIIEGNKLIADFMGYLNNEEKCPYFYARQHAYDYGNLRYHSEWNWLMPVVAKIKSYMPPMEDEELYERLLKEHGAIWECFWEVLPTVNIEIIYKHVLGFVRWQKLHSPNPLT